MPFQGMNFLEKILAISIGFGGWGRGYWPNSLAQGLGVDDNYLAAAFGFFLAVWPAI
jgi:hypothetical protein